MARNTRTYPNMARVTFIKNLDALNILRFWKIAQTNKYVLLDVEYSDYRTYSKAQKLRAEEQWLRLYDEYFILRDDSKSKSDLEWMFKGAILKAKINLLEELIKFAYSVKELERILPFQEIQQKKEEIVMMVKEQITDKVILASLQPINLLIDDLQRMKAGFSNRHRLYYKSNEQEFKDQLRNVFDVIANVNQWLDGILPRPQEMSVTEWLAYEKMCLKKQEAAKTAENGNKQ